MKKFYPPLFLLFSIALASAGIPQVSNILYSQRIDQNGSRTKLVDIQYDLDGNRSMYVEFFFSHDGGLSFPIICTAVSGDGGSGIQAGTSKNATWDASVDWDKNFTEQGRIMIKATYSDQPTGFPGLDGNGSFQEPFHVVELNSSINLEMIGVEPGTFMMGSPVTEVGRNENREAQRLVTLKNGFYLGKYEVTQAQYEAVMTGNDNNLSATPNLDNAENPFNNPNAPVTYIYLEEVRVFLSRLNSQQSTNLPFGWSYALPTEAQWEYACRAGTTTAYSWGEDASPVHAIFNQGIGTYPISVGTFPPNPWGFHDMHGNAWEWTADFHVDRPDHTLKGGSQYDYARHMRSAASAGIGPLQGGDLGFRLCLVPDDHEPFHVVELNSSINLEMIWVEPGTFTMGSPTSEVGRGTMETEHNVTLTKGFHLGKYEVTQAQYEAVMTGNTDGLSATPSYYGGYPNRPVENVSWADAQIFLTRLNSQQSAIIPAGWKYVLPTEAQWEYACRAGTTTAYSWGDEINPTLANYWDGVGNSPAVNSPVNVGSYLPNPWGFFDMHGNVWEWIHDEKKDYPGGARTDPMVTGSYNFFRGGSYVYTAKNLRSADRAQQYAGDHIGFRVAFQRQ